MTKKELAIFNDMYDKALGEYMKYVMAHENVPSVILERACVLEELKMALFPKVDIEVGA